MKIVQLPGGVQITETLPELVLDDGRRLPQLNSWTFMTRDQAIKGLRGFDAPPKLLAELAAEQAKEQGGGE